MKNHATGKGKMKIGEGYGKGKILLTHNHQGWRCRVFKGLSKQGLKATGKKGRKSGKKDSLRGPSAPGTKLYP